MAFGNATKGYVKKYSGGGGGGGTTNYNELSNLPSINGVTLTGNKTSEDLHIESGGGGVTWNSATISNNTITIPKTFNLATIYLRDSTGGYVASPLTVGKNAINGSLTSETPLRFFYGSYTSSSQVNVGSLWVSSSGDNYILTCNNVTFMNCDYI